MTHETASHSVRALVEAVMPALPSMPPAQRADCYDGIFFACQECAPDLALIAKRAAEALRAADHLQLQFGLLLSAAQNPQPEA